MNGHELKRVLRSQCVKTCKILCFAMVFQWCRSDNLYNIIVDTAALFLSFHICAMNVLL